MKKELKSPNLRFSSYEGTDGWEEVKLVDIGVTFSGLTGKSKEDFGEGTGLYIPYMNVYSNAIINDNILEKVKEDKKNQNIVECGDILVTMSSETIKDVGMTSVFTSKKRVYLNSFCFGFRLKDKDNNNPLYFGHLFRSPQVRRKIVLQGQGSTRFNLSQGRFVDISVEVPCLIEQERIGSFFSLLDEKIKLQENKVSSLQTYKQGLLHALMSQSLRFTDLQGNSYPDWEEVKLGDLILDTVDNRGKTPPVIEKGIPMIEINAVGNYKPRYEKVTKYVTEEVYNSFFRNYLKNGDILFSTVGNTCLCSYYTDDVKACVAQNIIGIRTNINSMYFMYLLNSNKRKIKEIEMKGVQPSVNVTQLKKVVLKTSLDLEEQQKIADLLSKLDHKISKEESKLEHLHKQKQGLMQQMFV